MSRGVPVGRGTVSAYVASGALAALASALYTAQAETGSPVLGQRLLLDIVGATVIGGASLFGGRGSVAGTAGGVLFVKLLDNSLDLLSLSNFGVMMVKGGVILARRPGGRGAHPRPGARCDRAARHLRRSSPACRCCATSALASRARAHPRAWSAGTAPASRR